MSHISEKVNWRIRWTCQKFHDFACEAEILEYERLLKKRGKLLVPDEEIVHERNLLMYGGASCLWECLKGNGTGTAGQSLTYFDNTNAAIGVGDSTTAAAATQTDLQASSNKLRKAMSSTFPTHTDGTSSGSATINYKSSFATGEANFAWQEVGIFNSATAATGRMLNRVVQSFGTKASGTWTMQADITLA